MAHYISYSLFDSPLLLGITVVILELIHALTPDFWKAVFIRLKPSVFWQELVIHNNSANRIAYAGDGSFKFLPY